MTDDLSGIQAALDDIQTRLHHLYECVYDLPQRRERLAAAVLPVLLGLPAGPRVSKDAVCREAVDWGDALGRALDLTPPGGVEGD